MDRLSPILIFNRGRILDIYSRDKSGNLIKVTEKNFYPYIYVEDEGGNIQTIDGKKVRRFVEFESPSNIPKWRSKYENEGKSVYEGDIIYVTRYAIDKYPALPEGEPWGFVPFRYVFIDIEVKDSLDIDNTPEPIVCLTLYDNFTDYYYTFTLYDNISSFVGEDWAIYTFTNERKMLKYVIELIRKLDPDLILAWNIEYDINYFVNRSKKMGLDPNRLARGGGISQINGKVRKLYGRAIVDYKSLFERLYSLKSYALENVAEELGLTLRKLKRKRISDMTAEEVVVYNKRDVEMLTLMEREIKVLKFWDEVRRIIGVPWNYLFDLEIGVSTKRIIDTYLLRLSRKNKVVLPTSSTPFGNTEVKHYKGAYVLEPPAGVFENVVVMDVKSMYPNIIRTYNISYETLDPSGEIKSPLGHKFKKSPRGILPQFADQLFEVRQKYKKLMKEASSEREKLEYDLKQRAVKIILNAGYGVFGYEKFRLYKREVAESITAYGRELLQHIINVCVRSGYKVLYGDTDSVFVKFPDDMTPSAVLSEAEDLLNEINDSFNGFASKWGADKHFHEIELKMLFKRIAFFGVKKRYSGYYIWNEGEWTEGIEKKGIEAVRGDTANITKYALDRAFELILVDGKSVKEAVSFISDLKEKVIRGEVPLEDLVFKVSYDPNKEYKNTNIPHLRGFEFAKKLGMVEGDPGEKLAWLYIKGYECDTIAVPESKLELLSDFMIDYNKNFERYFGNIERLLKMLVPSVVLSDFGGGV